MAILTFTPPVAPSTGMSNRPKLNILKAEFGDGYTQRAANGINNVRKVYNLSWDALLPEQASYIMTFILELNGYLPFYYTLPDEVTPIKFTCENVTDEHISTGLHKVTATFEQTFDLTT